MTELDRTQQLLIQIGSDIAKLSEQLDPDTLFELVRIDAARWRKMMVGTDKYGAWNPQTCVRDLVPGDLSEELVDAMNYYAMHLAKMTLLQPSESGEQVIGGTPQNWSKAGLRAAPGHVPLAIARGERAMEVHPDLPRQFYVGDAGVDLVVLEDRWIWPGQYVDLAHDVYVKIPPGYWMEVRGCSSTNFKRRLQVAHGTIDNTYDGEMKTAIFNPGWLPRKILRGDRLSQLVLVPLIPVDIKSSSDDGATWKESPRPHATRSGAKGFGSTR